MFDCILSKGIVVDGTGKPPYRADVAVSGDRIEAIGMLDGASAHKTIDITDRFVMPGIVDIHTHIDFTVCRDGHAEIAKPLIMQGITTMVGGNCGAGLAPLSKKNLEYQKNYIEVYSGMDFDELVKWRTFGKFLDVMETRGTPLNVAFLTPHGLLRIAAMGAKPGRPDASELAHMRRAMDRSLEEGSFGLSTGLMYPPGNQSDTDEIVTLAASAGRAGGIYTSHLRSYLSPTIDFAVDEAIEIGREASVPVQISHLFHAPYLGPLQPSFLKGVRLAAWTAKRLLLPPPPPKGQNEIMARIEAARADGVDVGADWMPSTTGFTHMLALMPPWVYLGTREQILDRLRAPETRRRIRRNLADWKCRWPHKTEADWSMNLIRICGYDNVRIMSVISERNKSMEGLSVAELARSHKKDPVDFICDLLVAENGNVLIFESLTEPEDAYTEQIIEQWLTAEVAITTDSILFDFGKPSPLFYGCFPRVLGRYVRDRRILALEEAVRKMTSLPASQARIKGRGEVREGNYADLVVFDPMTIDDRSRFDDVRNHPAGIDYVYINGRPVVSPEGYDAAGDAGHVLRRGEG